MRYGIGAAGGGLWYALNPRQRRAALGNYAAVLALRPDDPRVSQVAREAFANYGRMLMDFMAMGSISASELRSRVTVTGLEHVDEALRRGRGCLLAAPHMGSWDVGAAYAGARGYPIATVATRFPGSLDAAVVATRLKFGLSIIPPTRSSVRAITQKLASNETVALLCDLPHGPGVEVQFFGQRARVPSGPAALAIKTGAQLLPAHAYRTAPGRYHVAVEPALEPPPADVAAPKTRAQQMMQVVIDRFEPFIAARPEQWYAFMPIFERALVPAR